MAINNEDSVNVILEVCAALSAGDIERGKEIIITKYPHDKNFYKGEKAKRNYNQDSRQKSAFTVDPVTVETRNKDQYRLAIFMRDGFIDRYFGGKLIFNGTLRIISYHMPEIFPYISHGRTQLSHQAWWDLLPCVSHITPTKIDGSDGTENLICSSNRLSFQKLDATPEEVGWKVLPAGNLSDWDGTLHWFMDYVAKNPAVLENTYINNCHKACVTLKV